MPRSCRNCRGSWVGSRAGWRRTRRGSPRPARPWAVQRRGPRPRRGPAARRRSARRRSARRRSARRRSARHRPRRPQVEHPRPDGRYAPRRCLPPHRARSRPRQEAPRRRAARAQRHMPAGTRRRAPARLRPNLATMQPSTVATTGRAPTTIAGASLPFAQARRAAHGRDELVEERQQASGSWCAARRNGLRGWNRRRSPRMRSLRGPVPASAAE